MTEYPALEIRSPNIGGNLLAGAEAAGLMQDRALQNRLTAQQLEQNEQYRNLLGQYMGGGRDAATLNQLYQLDPDRTNQLVTYEREQQVFDDAERRKGAQEIVARMEHVLQSSDPVRAFRLASRFSDGSDLMEWMANEGYIDPSDGLDADEVRQIAEGLLAENRPLLELEQERTDTLARKLDTVSSQIRRPLTEEEVFRLAGSGGTTINIGEKLAEPIPIPQLQNVRLPDGSAPPIGTTFQQARDMGAQVLSTDEQKRGEQAQAALGILSELETLALGEGGVFRNVEPGFGNRAGAALLHGVNMLTQDDPNAARYEDLVKSSLAPFIKFLGESGALADGDVQRGLGLMPRLFPLPDTREVAEQKLSQVRAILERGVRNLSMIESGQKPALQKENKKSADAMSDDELRNALGL